MASKYLIDPADLFGEGVVAVKAEDPLVPLLIRQDKATGIAFKIFVKRMPILAFEDLMEELTKAQELPPGDIRDEEIAKCDEHFLTTVVPGWEGLNAANYYGIVNDGIRYEGGVWDEMYADPRKCMPFRPGLLRHIYRLAQGPLFRDRIQETMRQTVDRTIETRTDRKNDSAPTAV